MGKMTLALKGRRALTKYRVSERRTVPTIAIRAYVQLFLNNWDSGQKNDLANSKADPHGNGESHRLATIMLGLFTYIEQLYGFFSITH